MGGEIKGNEDRESVRSKSTKNFEWKSTTNGEKREEKTREKYRTNIRVLCPADRRKNGE